jgi:hypothetical protein
VAARKLVGEPALDEPFESGERLIGREADGTTDFFPCSRYCAREVVVYAVFFFAKTQRGEQFRPSVPSSPLE